MIVTTKVPAIINGEVKLQTVPIESILVTDNTVISIDGSTTNTGISILRRYDGAQIASISFAREKKKETPVEYKVYWKRKLYDILMSNRLINTVIYEEPFCGYASAAANLFMLRSSVEELVVENRPLLDHITRSEINNKRWKKNLLQPEKVPADSALEKQKIREKVLTFAPWMEDATQDEIDAYAMGFTTIKMLNQGGELSELESNKAIHKFKYNTQFMAADEDEGIYMNLLDQCKAPKSVLSNGISILELKRTDKFDKTIFRAMSDQDKLLILKFKSTTHGDIILANKLGDMLTYEYIYAIVWRVGRKQ